MRSPREAVIISKVVAALIACAVVLVLTAALANPARAAEITVVNTNDSGPGSLRAAIDTANTNNQPDTITFSVTGQITLTTGELTIGPDGGNALTIDGPGADQLSVSGNNSSRVFLIDGEAEATIEGLTVKDGREELDDDGSGIMNESGTLTLNRSIVSENVSSLGGGIFNGDVGTLTLNRSTVSANSASLAGGIYNTGTLTITDSTISDNASSGAGGGIFTSTDSVTDTNPNPAERATISNSTISGNVARNSGGGIRQDFGFLIIKNTTITQNTAPEDGGGVTSVGDSRTRTDVRASIISENTETDADFIFGATNPFNSLGSNIVGDGNATGAFNESGDRTGIDNPGLGPLQDNGGPTQTHAVLSGSPALDAVVDNCGVTVDQRGVLRPQGEACDVGSFEKRLIPPPAPVPPALTPPAPKPPITNPKPLKNPGACTIKGTRRDDVLRGTPKRDVICGFGGNDIIRGLGGNDLIRGGGGDDVIYGNRGNDRLLGQRGNDSLFGGRGRDVLLGGKGKNTLLGGPGKDVEKGGVTPTKNKKKTKKLIADIFSQVGLR